MLCWILWGGYILFRFFFGQKFQQCIIIFLSYYKKREEKKVWTYAKYLYYKNSHIKCVCNNIISLRWCVKITRMIYGESILNCFCCSKEKKSLKFKFKTLFSNVRHIKYSGINCFQEATKKNVVIYAFSFM